MWTITKDHIDNGSAVGIVGFSMHEESGNYDTQFLAPIIKARGTHFKMYDDDGVLYYEGYSTSSDDENAFGPLDDFGEPNAGCTGIKYREASGKYKWL